MSLLKFAVRTKFACTSRGKADKDIENEAERTLAIVRSVSEEQAGQSVRVPSMPGVDDDMREWSLFMILEHNTIVNQQFERIVCALAKGEEYQTDFNAKTDVMPGVSPGPEQVELFQKSVTSYQAAVAPLEKLKGTARRPHPVFGPMDAHGWHCMFGFHLSLHRRQGAAICRKLAETG